MKVKRARLQLWVVPLVLVLAGILYLVLYNSRASRNAPSYHEIEEFWLHSARPQQDGSGKTKIAANIAYQQGDKVAVVVVARPNNKVPSLMHNLAANLPAEWKLQIFHSPEIASYITWLARGSLKPYMETGRLKFTATVPNGLSYNDYSSLLLSADFWEQVEGEHVLVAQTDAAICANSPHSVDEFLQYDWVGAPWGIPMKGVQYAPLGNGGLSLRKKSKLLEAIRRCHHPPYNEDVWFGECFYKLGMSDSNFSLKLPPIEVASAFSVETVYSPHPFGAHKPWLYLPRTQLLQLFEYCPELAVGAIEWAMEKPWWALWW